MTVTMTKALTPTSDAIPKTVKKGNQPQFAGANCPGGLAGANPIIYYFFLKKGVDFG